MKYGMVPLLIITAFFISIANCTIPVSGGTPVQPVSEHVPPAPVYDDIGIFVSNAGNNQDGDGTIENPYQTIQHVLDNVACSGDTILLRGGTYAEAIRIRNPNITIRSKSDEWALIQTPTTNEDIGVTITLDVDSDGSKLQRLEITGGYYYGIMTFTKWEWGDPNDRSGACNITIEDCVIHDTGRDCIKVTPQCDDMTIRRCEIFNSGIRYDGNAEGIDNVNSDRMLVQDCHIHDTATSGLYFKGGATDCIVERTWIENCGSLGIVLGFDTSVEWFDLIANPEYYENINGIVRNCVVINTVYAGIGMYAASNPKVYNNTIINAAQTGHSSIYFGLSYQDWDPDAGRPPTINPHIKNNIVYQSTSDVIFVRYSDDLGGMSALSGMPDMSHNCYHVSSGTSNFEDRRPGSTYSGNLTGWQSHTGSDQDSFCNDPLLDSQYHLQAASQCIDNGMTLPDVSYDIDRELRDGIYDIGADERK